MREKWSIFKMSTEYKSSELPELLKQYYAWLFPYDKYYDWLSYGEGVCTDCWNYVSTNYRTPCNPSERVKIPTNTEVTCILIFHYVVKFPDVPVSIASNAIPTSLIHWIGRPCLWGHPNWEIESTKVLSDILVNLCKLLLGLINSDDNYLESERLFFSLSILLSNVALASPLKTWHC